MKNKHLTTTLRVTTGVVLTAAVAVLAMNIGGISLQAIEGETASIKVNPSEVSSRTIVCQGPFTILGANPSDPTLAVPTGKSDVTIFGEPGSQRDLITADEVKSEEQQPVALTGGIHETLAAATTQGLMLEEVNGQTAVSCAEAVSDQWIAAGDTLRGTTATVVVSNPSPVPSTVSITVHDETGEVGSLGTSGVLVAANSQRVVSLGGFGAGRASTVVRVQSSGAPVVVSMNVTEIKDLLPSGSAGVNAVSEPQETLVFAGVVNRFENIHTVEEEDAHHNDEYPATVRLMSFTESATATVVGLTKKGTERDLAEVSLEPGIVVDTSLETLPADVQAIVVRSTEAVVGGLKTSVHTGSSHDFTWMSPASIFEPEQPAHIATVKDATPTIVNLDSADTTVTITDSSGKSKTVDLAAGATRELSKGKSVTISSTGLISAGVVSYGGRDLATYPVLAAAPTLGEITVHPR